MSDQTKRVAVIGAGIVGVSTAIHLQRAGHSAILIDREGPAAGTSYGNAGVLASASVVPVNVPGLWRKAPKMLFDGNQPLFLKWGYLPKLLPWLARYLSYGKPQETRRIAAALHGIVGASLEEHQALAAGTGAERYVMASDYVFAYPTRAAYEADAFGWSIRRAEGFAWDELGADALAAYEPTLSPSLSFAVRLPNHGRITDPGAYVKTLAAHAEATGATIVTATADDIVRENGRVTGVRVTTASGADTIACEAVALCTGVWSGPLAKALGVAAPLESERGYHMELWGANISPRAPTTITTGKFVATPMEGRLRLAGIVEFGGLNAPPSRTPFDLLKRQALAAFPGLTWDETREWMGHRPATVDSIPLIGPSPTLAGAYMGFGHHHIGLTAGPKTGRLLAQLIAGQTPNQDITPYAPARFASR